MFEPGPFDPTVTFREAKRRAMEEWERWYVLALLEYTNGNLSRASRVAQTDRTYLRKLLRRYTNTTGGESSESSQADETERVSVFG
jgi:DNA-binding NtrC family response regulator